MDSLLDESFFLINMYAFWYGNITLYLQTQHFRPELSYNDRRDISHHANYYVIVGNTLYHQGIDSIFMDVSHSQQGRACVG